MHTNQSELALPHKEVREKRNMCDGFPKNIE